MIYTSRLGGALAGQKNFLYGLGRNPVAGNNIIIDLAELWLANNIFYTVWVEIQLLERMLTLLDLDIF